MSGCPVRSPQRPGSFCFAGFRAAQNRLSGSAPSQLMLIPRHIVLDHGEYEALLRCESEIKGMGFGFAPDEGSHSADMISYPAQLDAEEAAALFEALVSALASGDGPEPTRAAFFEKALLSSPYRRPIPQPFLTLICTERARLK